MNTGHRQIPSSMPIEAAANIMVQRGEAKSFGQACHQLRAQRKNRREYGRVEITSADRDEVAKSFGKPRLASPQHYRLPYADN